MAVMPSHRTELPPRNRPRLEIVPPSRPAQRIVSVEFRSPHGETWHAIGGGDTPAEAILWARESCPLGTTWEPVAWEDLYGE
jgi:hypothetical protein